MCDIINNLCNLVHKEEEEFLNKLLRKRLKQKINNILHNKLILNMKMCLLVKDIPINNLKMNLMMNMVFYIIIYIDSEEGEINIDSEDEE